jgi:hypothetical protein
MYFVRSLVALLVCAAAAARAQSASAPLDLALPTGAAATTSPASTPAEPKADPAPPATTPSTALDAASLSQPYDTTYGDRRDAATQEGCDDKTYSQPELHGSVGMGVAASKHANANYETAELNASKALGSCDDPKGNVSASIRVTNSNVNFRRGHGP